MRAINLPTDLLRAFVSVIDLGGYTRAADALGRTQPAISLQMKRLEELLDAKLLAHEGAEYVIAPPVCGNVGGVHVEPAGHAHQPEIRLPQS
mgnify:CR=1 FL=1